MQDEQTCEECQRAHGTDTVAPVHGEQDEHVCRCVNEFSVDTAIGLLSGDKLVGYISQLELRAQEAVRLLRSFHCSFHEVYTPVRRAIDVLEGKRNKAKELAEMYGCMDFDEMERRATAREASALCDLVLTSIESERWDIIVCDDGVMFKRVR